MDASMVDRARGALLGGVAASPGDGDAGLATSIIALAQALLRPDGVGDDELAAAFAGRADADLAAVIAPVAVRFMNDYVWLYACARRCAAVVECDAAAADAALVQAAALGAALLDEDPLQAALAAAETREVRRGLAREGDHDAAPIAVAARAGTFEQVLEAGPAAGALAGARFGASAIPSSRLAAVESRGRLSSAAEELERCARESPGRMFRLPRRA
jgi:hypothetical protein